MGLIKAITSSVSQTLGDQFKEFVTCPSIDSNVLIQRGIVNHGKGNKNPSEGVISNGSAIVVPEGMAMMIIDNGEIKEFTATPGTFTYDTSSEPSIFTGKLGEGIKNTFKTIGKRFTYGGMPARDQRVYYVNLLVITGNKFGSPQPKKITDEKYGMLEVTFFGEYAFQVKDPIILVQNVIGANSKDTVTYEEVVGGQLKSKFVEQITQALTIVMRKHKVSFGDIGMYGGDISNEMNIILDESWHQQYGLEITDVAIADINLTEESMKRVSRIDDATIFSNPNLQSGLMAQSSAKAMETAAGNEGGAMVGFMGMNMASQTGSNMMASVNQNVNGTYQAPVNNQPEPGTIFNHQQPQANTEVAIDSSNTSEEILDTKEETDTKEEVKTNIPNFCPNCGTKTTGGNFCSNCGQKLN